MRALHGLFIFSLILYFPTIYPLTTSPHVEKEQSALREQVEERIAQYAFSAIMALPLDPLPAEQLAAYPPINAADDQAEISITVGDDDPLLTNEAAQEPSPEQLAENVAAKHAYHTYFIDLLASSQDYVLLEEFAKRADLEALLFIAAKNKTLFKISSAQDKILTLPEATLAPLLLEDDDLLRAFVGKTTDKQFLRTTKGNPVLKAKTGVKERLDEIFTRSKPLTGEALRAQLRDSKLRFRDRPIDTYFIPADEADERERKSKQQWQNFRENQSLTKLTGDWKSIGKNLRVSLIAM